MVAVIEAKAAQQSDGRVGWKVYIWKVYIMRALGPLTSFSMTDNCRSKSPRRT
jgi:hypothetical protein